MKLIRHGIAALVIFAVLIGLFLSAYNNTISAYGLERQYTKEIDGKQYDIGQALENLNIISGINQTMEGIYTIKNPTGNIIDTLGALASAGIGILKLVGGLLTFPFEILNIVALFYHVPPILVTGLGLLVVIYLGFILVSAYIRGDV